MNNENGEPLKALENLEKHPFFPSGEWEGFYTYAFGPDARRHMMSFALTFNNGKVSGDGIDNVDRFIWRGSYDTEKLRCWMKKRYPSHTVFYDGYVDRNGIWGTWQIPPDFRGGFHIWPKGLSDGLTVEDKETLPASVSLALSPTSCILPIRSQPSLTACLLTLTVAQLKIYQAFYAFCGF